jgi:hypothetical protein
MRSIGLLMLLAFSQVCFCQTPTDAPSLEVTMNWLVANLRSAKSQINTETVVFDKNGKPKAKTRKDTVDSVVLMAKADGCELTIMTQVKWNFDLAKTSVETIPMGRVNVTLEDFTREAQTPGAHITYNPASTIHINLTAPSALIRNSITTHRIDNSVSDSTTTVQSKRTSVELDDAQLAPRLLKAMEHASQLCHAIPTTPEPF